MALDVSTFVDIDTQVAAGGVPRLDFGIGLLVTTDETLPAGGSGKAVIYNSIEAVTKAFGEGSVKDGAAVWFAADPPPKSLMIGRWAHMDVPTTLRGAAPAAVASASLAAANSRFAVNGQDVAADLSGANTYNAKAAVIQEAIRKLGGGLAGATFAYENAAFTLTLAGATVIEGGVFGPPSEGTDISTALGFSADAGPTYRQGHDQESVAAAVVEMAALSKQGAPVALMIDTNVPLLVNGIDTRDALSTFAQGGDWMFGLLDTAEAALVQAEAGSKLALAFAAARDKIVPAYSIPGQRPDIGILAALSAQDLDQPATIITLDGKPLPGVLPSPVDDAQAAELARKNANVYATVAGLPSLVGGSSARTGYWLDAVWWLLWMKNNLQRSIWLAKRGSRRFTNAILADTLLEVAQAGVSNGGIQPGRTVTQTVKADIIATTGNRNFDGVLTTGFLPYVTRNRTDSDTENRVGRFKLWCTGSEAIHKVFGDVVFQN